MSFHGGSFTNEHVRNVEGLFPNSSNNSTDMDRVFTTNGGNFSVTPRPLVVLPYPQRSQTRMLMTTRRLPDDSGQPEG